MYTVLISLDEYLCTKMEAGCVLLTSDNKFVDTVLGDDDVGGDLLNLWDDG